MSSAKRRKLDQDTASNASGTGVRGPSNGNAATAAAAGGRRGGGGPGSRGGHSAATASRAAAAAAATVPATLSAIAQAGAVSLGALAPYVPVLALSSLPVSALSKYALHYGLVPPEPLTVAQATFPTRALPFELKLADSYTVPARSRTSQERRHRSPYISARGTHQPSPSASAAPNANASQPVKASRRSEELDTTDSGTKTQLSAKEDDVSSVALKGASVNGTGGVDGALGLDDFAKSRTTSNEGDGPNSARKVQQQSGEWLDPGEADAQELRGMSAYEGGDEQLKDRLGLLARVHWDKLPAIKEAETVVNFAYAIRMRSKVLKSAPMV